MLPSDKIDLKPKTVVRHSTGHKHCAVFLITWCFAEWQKGFPHSGFGRTQIVCLYNSCNTYPLLKTTYFPINIDDVFPGTSVVACVMFMYVCILRAL